ncbi:MAG: hypothetical protein ACE5KQ_04720 [Thermoplasmata archaeon]
MTAIPGLTVTRFFDAGELWASGSFSVFNATGAPSNFEGMILLDGAEVLSNRPSTSVPNNSFGHFSFGLILPISRGVHTIALAARGRAPVGDTVDLNSGVFTVIQLPRWDQEDDLL